MNPAPFYHGIIVNPALLYNEYIVSKRINFNKDEASVQRMKDFGEIINSHKNSYMLVPHGHSISQESYDKAHAVLESIDRYNLMAKHYMRFDQSRKEARKNLTQSVRTIHDVFRFSSGFLDRQSAEWKLRRIERQFEGSAFIEQMRHCREDLERIFTRLMDNTIQGKPLPGHIDRDLDACHQFLQSVPEIVTAINDNVSILSGRKPA